MRPAGRTLAMSEIYHGSVSQELRGEKVVFQKKERKTYLLPSVSQNILVGKKCKIAFFLILFAAIIIVFGIFVLLLLLLLLPVPIMFKSFIGKKKTFQVQIQILFSNSKLSVFELYTHVSSEVVKLVKNNETSVVVKVQL